MFEACSTIYDREKVLQEKITDVSFIGQIDITQDELQNLITQLRDIVSSDQELGLQFLRDQVPVTIACIMVQLGFYHYQDGAYWEAVFDHLGLQDTTNARLTLSHLFIRVLRQYASLELPYIKGALRYITPILLHGGIPSSGFPQLFHSIIKTFVENKIFDDQLIRVEILQARKSYFDYLTHIQDEEVSRKEIEQLQLRVKSLWWLSIWDKAYHVYQEKAELPDEWQHVQDANDYLFQAEQISNQIRVTIDHLMLQESIVSDCQEQIKSLNDMCQRKKNLIMSLEMTELKVQEIYHLLFNSTMKDEHFNQVLCIESTDLKERWDVIAQLRAQMDKISQEAPAAVSLWKSKSLNRSGRHRWTKPAVQRTRQMWLESIKSFKRNIEHIETELHELLGDLQLRSYSDHEEWIANLSVLKSLLPRRNALLDTLVQVQGNIAEGFNSISESAATTTINLAPLVNDEDSIQEAIEKNNITISELRKKRSDKCKELEKIDVIVNNFKDFLALIGNGNIQQGLFEFGNRKKAAARLTRCSVKRKDQYAINDLTPEFDDVVSALEREKINLQEKKNVQKSLEGQIKSFAHPYPYVDEPIQRFLLYGGSWAEDWICMAVRLANVQINDEELHQLYPSIPGRVQYRFKECIVQYYSEQDDQNEEVSDSNWGDMAFALHDESEISNGDISENSDIGPRFRKPIVRLDPALCRIQLIIPSQRFSQVSYGGKCFAVVSNKAIQSKRQIIALHAYKKTASLIETESCELELDCLVAKLNVAIYSGPMLLHKWKISLSEGKQRCLVFSLDGKQVSLNSIKGERMWLVSPTGYSIVPADSVCVEQSVGEIDIRLIDFGTYGKIEFLSSSHPYFTLTRAMSGNEHPVLMGDCIAHLSSHGLNVYSDIPVVRLPYIPGVPIGWELAIRCLDSEDAKTDTFTIRNSDVNFVPKGKYALFDLAELPFLNIIQMGRVGLALKQEDIIYRLDFTIIPEMDVTIDPTFVLPSDKIVRFSLSLTMPPNMYPATVNSDIDIVKGQGEFSLSAPGSLYKFDFDVCDDTLQQNRNLTMQVTLPKVTWKLGEEEPNFSHEELWWDDWRTKEEISLTVSVPFTAVQRVRLRLGSSAMYKEVPIKNGVASFDLKVFNDELAQSEVKPLVVEFLDSNMKLLKKGSLLSIRSKWRVKDIEPIMIRSNQLSLTWNEYGRCDNKQLRIWQLGNPWKPPFTISLLEQDRACSISSQLLNDLPGSVLFEFAEDDEWGADIPVFPKTIDNTRQLHVPFDQPYVEECLINWKSGVSASLKGCIKEVPQDTYIIAVFIGVLESQICVAYEGFRIGIGGQFVCTISEPNLKRFAHWIGLYCPDNPHFSYFTIIKDPAMLEWSVQSPQGSAIVGKAGTRLKVTSEKVKLDDSLIPQDISTSILSSWRLGKGSLEFYTKFDDNRQKILLSWDEKGAATIKFPFYRCATCHQIVPSQQFWGQHHYPKCKAIDTKGTQEVAAQLHLVWDVTTILKRYTGKYPLAESYIPILHTGRLPNSIQWHSQQSVMLDYNETAVWLWQKELSLADPMEGN